VFGQLVVRTATVKAGGMERWATKNALRSSEYIGQIA
jgi:hypothetical protein